MIPSHAAPITHTVYRTQWGPVLAIPRAGLTWSATTAYAIADANTLNTRSADTWMRMNRARSVQELREAMGNQGIPWVNTIGADRAGNALYADLSVVPLWDGERCDPNEGGLLSTYGGGHFDGMKATLQLTTAEVHSGAGAYRIDTNGPILAAGHGTSISFPIQPGTANRVV